MPKPTLLVFANVLDHYRRVFMVVNTPTQRRDALSLAGEAMVFLDALELAPDVLYTNDVIQCLQHKVAADQSGKNVCVVHPDLIRYRYRVAVSVSPDQVNYQFDGVGGIRLKYHFSTPLSGAGSWRPCNEGPPKDLIGTVWGFARPLSSTETLSAGLICLTEEDV